METRVIKLADIKPAPYNPRVQLTPKDQEYKALDASIEENGLVLPLIVNIRDNCLIGGHQRLSVLLAAGETETNAVVVDMPEAQAKALCIALNKLDGEWDYGQLADIIQQLIDDGYGRVRYGGLWDHADRRGDGLERHADRSHHRHGRHRRTVFPYHGGGP